jgi:hypothetical protein
VSEMIQYQLGNVVKGADIIETHERLISVDMELTQAIMTLRTSDRMFNLDAAEKDERISVKLLVQAYKENRAKIEHLQKLSFEVVAF